jgi:ribosomal silencing factor RsfS
MYGSIIFFVFIVSNSFACICVRKTVEEKFCDTNFVVQAKVKFRINLIDKTIYGVQIYRKFKWSGKLESSWGENWINGNQIISSNNSENENFEIFRIWTTRKIEECGQHFNVDEIYVISFDLDKDGATAITSLCHIGEKFTNFGPEEKAFFLNGFKNIDCNHIQIFQNLFQKNSKNDEMQDLVSSKEHKKPFQPDKIYNHDYNKVSTIIPLPFKNPTIYMPDEAHKYEQNDKLFDQNFKIKSTKTTRFEESNIKDIISNNVLNDPEKSKIPVREQIQNILNHLQIHKQVGVNDENIFKIEPTTISYEINHIYNVSTQSHQINQLDKPTINNLQNESTKTSPFEKDETRDILINDAKKQKLPVKDQIKNILNQIQNQKDIKNGENNSKIESSTTIVSGMNNFNSLSTEHHKINQPDKPVIKDLSNDFTNLNLSEKDKIHDTLIEIPEKSKLPVKDQLQNILNQLQNQKGNQIVENNSKFELSTTLVYGMNNFNSLTTEQQKINQPDKLVKDLSKDFTKLDLSDKDKIHDTLIEIPEKSKLPVKDQLQNILNQLQNQKENKLKILTTKSSTSEMLHNIHKSTQLYDHNQTEQSYATKVLNLPTESYFLPKERGQNLSNESEAQNNSSKNITNNILIENQRPDPTDEHNANKSAHFGEIHGSYISTETQSLSQLDKLTTPVSETKVKASNNIKREKARDIIKNPETIDFDLNNALQKQNKSNISESTGGIAMKQEHNTDQDDSEIEDTDINEPINSGDLDDHHENNGIQEDLEIDNTDLEKPISTVDLNDEDEHHQIHDIDDIHESHVQQEVHDIQDINIHQNNNQLDKPQKPQNEIDEEGEMDNIPDSCACIPEDNEEIKVESLTVAPSTKIRKKTTRMLTTEKGKPKTTIITTTAKIEVIRTTMKKPMKFTKSRQPKKPLTTEKTNFEPTLKFKPTKPIKIKSVTTVKYITKKRPLKANPLLKASTMRVKSKSKTKPTKRKIAKPDEDFNDEECHCTLDNIDEEEELGPDDDKCGCQLDSDYFI